MLIHLFIHMDLLYNIFMIFLELMTEFSFWHELSFNYALDVQGETDNFDNPYIFISCGP